RDVFADLGQALSDAVELGLHAGHAIAQRPQLLVHLRRRDVHARVRGRHRTSSGGRLGTAQVKPSAARTARPAAPPSAAVTTSSVTATDRDPAPAAVAATTAFHIFEMRMVRTPSSRAR